MFDTISSIKDMFKRFLNKLLHRPQPVSYIDLEETPALVTQEKKTRKPRTNNKEKIQDFSELLDNLKYTFEAVKLPTMKESWLEKDSSIGLKKIGVHVPNPWEIKFSKGDVKVDITKTLPAIMCISIANEDSVNKKDIVYPKILFAVKLKKLPWYVSKATGVPYQYGISYDWDGKLFWMHMYITVNKSTGEIKFCDVLNLKECSVGNGKIFFNKSWRNPSLLQDGRRTIEENKQITKNLFVAMHEWWVCRDERWNVVVKKNGERVTFGVDNGQTPYYFKDRDKSIKTASGQTKKIVHYVKGHDREVNGKTIPIKEHIRGLQEFDWAGYNCLVVSPKFQSQTAAKFDVAGTDMEPDSKSKDNVIYLSKLGKLIADSEENVKKRSVG